MSEIQKNDFLEASNRKIQGLENQMKEEITLKFIECGDLKKYNEYLGYCINNLNFVTPKECLKCFTEDEDLYQQEQEE